MDSRDNLDRSGISFHRVPNSISSRDSMGGHQGSSTERFSSATWFSQLCTSARRFKSLAPPSLETAVRSTSGDSLVRRLGLCDLILLGIGASIGAGVFVVTGTVARDAGPGQLGNLSS